DATVTGVQTCALPISAQLAVDPAAEVRRRVAQQDRARAVVEARRDPKLAKLGPHRIVIVLAVDADRVVPLDELRRVGMLFDEREIGRASCREVVACAR